MVYVSSDIQIHSTGWFVALDESMPAKWVVVGIDILEDLWRRDFTRVPEGMSGDVVLLQEVLFQSRRKVIECRPGVSIFSVPSCAFRWEFMGAEKRVACSTGIEARIYMEKIISLHIGY